MPALVGAVVGGTGLVVVVVVVVVEVGLGNVLAPSNWGGLTVEDAEVDVVVLVATGRRSAWEGSGAEGESGAGEVVMTSKGLGEAFIGLGVGIVSSSSRALTLPSLLGEAGGVSPSRLALLVCLDGEPGTLKLLPGLANGLVGRSEV